MHEQREKVVGWWLFCGGGVSDTVGGRSIGCQIGRTSPWSCFRGWGVAPSCFGRNAKRGASSPGYCGWCADTFQPELVACSRAAQIVDESLGDFHGGWVQKKNGIMVPMFFWLFMWDLSYKNEITCVVHGIMVPIFSRPFMCDFPHQNEIICVMQDIMVLSLFWWFLWSLSRRKWDSVCHLLLYGIGHFFFVCKRMQAYQ